MSIYKFNENNQEKNQKNTDKDAKTKLYVPSLMMQRKIDDSRWEDDIMRSSGIGSKMEVDINIENDEVENRIYIRVNTQKPSFLENLDETRFQKQRIDYKYNTEGDLYDLARNGSEAVADWKKKRKKESNGMQTNEYRTDDNSFAFDQKKVSFKDSFKSLGKINRNVLPIMDFKDDILRVADENNVIIIVGETGSGKTTQLTQIFYESGYAKNGMIACTQPRRVAAVSVAKRVAEEMKVEIGTLVGYSIRFEDVTSESTKIRYMVDGILLRESLNDDILSKYSVIIMDEAHERSLNTDVLFGVLKKVITMRMDIKIIITSATMDATKFSTYFNDAPIFHIKGRTFKVESLFLTQNPTDYVAEAVKQATEIHLREPPGDILIFMTGQDDVECTCSLISERLSQITNCPPLAVLPIYSQLDVDLQTRVFMDYNIRKCVVATNIAETSLTIDGIRYVIDSGFCKQKNYSSKAGLDTLLVQPISKAQAIQREGRAGRTSEGKCWKLYSEISYNSQMLPNTIPEIMRTNLANVILLLKSMGFHDVLDFNFMDSPPVDNFKHALYILYSLRALNDEGRLTKLGFNMVKFPLDPSLSKMILSGHKYGCLDECLTIVSMLSVPEVFYRPKGKEEEADNMRSKFIHPESDHLTLLHVYNTWANIGKDPTSLSTEKISWCKRHYIHHTRLQKAFEIRKQLVDICKSSGYIISKCENGDWDNVRKAICSSYFHNTAKQKGVNEYYNLHSKVQCFIHPSSAISGQSFIPEYIVYHELVLTSKNYLHGITAVDPLWLSQMAPQFFVAVDAFGDVIEEGKPKPEDYEDVEVYKVEKTEESCVKKHEMHHIINKNKERMKSGTSMPPSIHKKLSLF